jgi:hypothetical protein
MAGAALPDIDKPAKLWFGQSPWPEPVNRFHSAIQNEASHRFRTEMATMGVLAVAGLLAVRAKPSHVTRQDAHITRRCGTKAVFRARPSPGA